VGNGEKEACEEEWNEKTVVPPKNLSMKSFGAQNLGLQAGTNADVQQINALKTLENPARSGTVSRFVHLVRNGLFGCRKLRAQQPLGVAACRARGRLRSSSSGFDGVLVLARAAFTWPRNAGDLVV